ncbi:MAG: hypothetical protein M3373_09665 [Gemmatimonadota bacterium]|nr:hypothetical protein [Gemmatimonadota bacterium]
MTHAVQPSFEPPQWPQAVLRFVVRCDPMRDAIFGDLHEEFVHDVVRPMAADVARVLYSTYARPRSSSRDAGFAVWALAVLVVGIVANTIAFTAVQDMQRPAEHGGSIVLSAFGIGGFVLLLACAGVAAVVICAGPRWRRKGPQGCSRVAPRVSPDMRA